MVVAPDERQGLRAGRGGKIHLVTHLGKIGLVPQKDRHALRRHTHTQKYHVRYTHIPSLCKLALDTHAVTHCHGE